MLGDIASIHHLIFNAHRMPVSEGIRRTESIYEKIWRTESPRFFQAKRFGMPNLFANRFDVLYPVARYHPIGFKCKIVGSGKILDALDNGLRSDRLIKCTYSTFPYSILMI